MKFGYRLVIHNSVTFDAHLNEFLENTIEHFNSENSYKCRSMSGAFYRRGIFGFSLTKSFGSSSMGNDIKYTFRRLCNRRRIFGVVPINILESRTDKPIDLDQCMCGIHRGGQKVRLNKPYAEEDYTTFYETGEIKG